jgi:hypothetical protein
MDALNELLKKYYPSIREDAVVTGTARGIVERLTRH